MTHVVEINNPALPIPGESRLAPKSTAGWQSSTGSEFHSALADAQGSGQNSSINQQDTLSINAEAGFGNSASQPKATESEARSQSSELSQIWADETVPGEPLSNDSRGLVEPIAGQQLPPSGSPLPSPEAKLLADRTGVSTLSTGRLSINFAEGTPLNSGNRGFDPFSVSPLNQAVLNPALTASTSQANRVSHSETKGLSIGTSMMGQEDSMSRAQETVQIQSQALHRVMRQSGASSLTHNEGSVALPQSEPVSNRSEFGAPRQYLFAELLAPRSLALSSDVRFGPKVVAGEASLKGAPLVPLPTTGVPIEFNPTSAFRMPSGFEMNSGVAQGQMVTSFQHAAWAQELAQQTKFMVQDQVRFVELKLNPANLGTVEVVMKQEDDQTTLMFFAKNALVREALESTLQRLQKSFSDDGLDLDQAFVSDQSLAEHKEQNDYGFEQEGQSANKELTESLPSQERNVTAPERLLVAANDYRIDVWA
jgi:flagellar hook-length control protein FliK